jgi:hypothetical protein
MTSNGEFLNLANAQTALAYWSWEINESLFGMRVQDIIRSVDYVLSRSDVNRAGVRLIGKGQGALWSLFAAALDPRILATVCDGGLLSYRTLTQGDHYRYSADIVLPGVLKYFDLPQVAAAVADRPLALLAPVDAMQNSVDVGLARKTYQWTQEVYKAVGAAARFRLRESGGGVRIVERYLELLS